jgi:2-amino-4-hydroxy-6-hydroxymethyldihydropteridine diphosphokinase
MTTAYIALGSNVGQREQTLMEAVQSLATHGEITVARLSQWLKTEPVGGPEDQPWYLNGVVRIETTLTAQSLLAVMQQIETSLGRDRRREVRWGPRTCDLDLLLFGDGIIDTPDLIVPHPRLAERRFVLEPLAQLACDLIVPGGELSVAELLIDAMVSYDSES